MEDCFCKYTLIFHDLWFYNVDTTKLPYTNGSHPRPVLSHAVLSALNWGLENGDIAPIYPDWGMANSDIGHIHPDSVIVVADISPNSDWGRANGDIVSIYPD